MIGSWERALAFTLGFEGGWVEHSQDPGGATMKGVTLATYRDWKGGLRATKEQLRAISDDEVAMIYRARYWNAVDADRLPAGVDASVFDMAVNAGPGRSARQLQEVLGTTQDGKVGPQTLQVVEGWDARGVREVIEGLARVQERYYRGLGHFAHFGRGWLRRCEERRVFALSLCGGPAATEA